MKNGNGSFLVFSFLGIFFLMLLNHANAEDTIEPRKNVNLSPFESWRSAYFCMVNNHSKACSSKDTYTLSLSGYLNVQQSEINDYCKKGGCQEHTLGVLKCIQDVKRDFKFANKALLSFVRNATIKACNKLQGFNTNYTAPSGH